MSEPRGHVPPVAPYVQADLLPRAKVRYNRIGSGVGSMQDDPEDLVRQAVEDYRRQLQARDAARSGFAAMTKADFITWAEANHERLVAEAANYGASPEGARAAVAQYVEDIRTLPELSTFDDVNVYLILRRVLGEIEDACRTLEIPTHGGVVFGSSPVLGQQAGQRPVLLAKGVSIVTVSMSFVPFCDLIARVMARTLVCDPSQDAIVNDPDEVRAKLAASPHVVEQWARLIFFCAKYDLHPIKEEVALSEMEAYACTSLLRAIELFAIGHEYAHHILEHGQAAGTGDTSDPIAEELEADWISQGVSKIIGGDDDPPNEYAISGVGAVVILGALQLVRRAKAVLETGDDTLPKSSSHPTFEGRVAQLAAVDASAPADLQAAFGDRRAAFVQILEAVWAHLAPRFRSLHDQGVRPHPPAPSRQDWLPLSRVLSR